MHKICGKFSPVILPMALFALIPVAQASRADRLAKFQKYAGAPVAQFHYFNLTGYETLADNTVAVWTGANKVYLIKVLPPCPDFEFSRSMSLNSSSTNLFSQKFSSVRFGQDNCMVKSIRPVDYRAMRKDRASEKTGKPKSD